MSPLLTGGGQIRCLEDTDGDGKYDKATIFLEVPYPTGVLPWRKGVLVTAAPNILYAEDTDGDGKADKREVLYTGFVEGNQQHRVNGLVWGLDNWIYVANGDSGGVIESKKTGKKVNISGRDLRIHPDSGDLDAVTGQTQFGRSRDDWGNWFGCNNSNPMYQFVLDDAYQRRNPHYAAGSPRVDVPEVAGNAPVFPISRLLTRFNDFHTANRFTSACSAMIYRDDLFGPHFAGNAFICEPVHNLVHREVVTPKGVTFTSRRAADEEQSEFLASNDNWFRPTTVKTGPDGALWITDMYRHVIEHPQWIPDTWQKQLDLRAGRDQGRIYRVYPVDKKPRPIPRLDKLDTAGLVAALDSPGGWQRDVIQQLLIERQDKAAIPLLESQATDCPRPEGRLHALATLAGFDAAREPLLVKALADRHPGVRRHAVRLMAQLSSLSSDALAALLERTKDPDPHVRLQLAYTLGEIKGETAGEQAGVAIGQMLVAEGTDRFLFSALMSSVNKANVEKVLSNVVTEMRSTTPNQNLIGNLLDLAAAFGNDQALAKLVRYVTEEQNGKFADWQFTAFARLLDSLARRNESLVKKINPAKVPDTDKILVAVDRLYTAARQLSANPGAAVEVRIAALRLLGRGRDQEKSDLDTLASFLAPQTPPELQQAAVQALGRLRNDRIPGLLLEAWRGYGPARRSQVLDLLASRDEWAAELTAAVAAGKLPPTDFDAVRRQRLLEHRSPDVRQKAARAFAVAVNADRQKVVDQYQSALTLSGDATRGAQLFAKTCAQCHMLAGMGYDVGPDLASLTDKSPEALLVAVLDPNRAVESKFLSYVAETKAGTIYAGILASETGNSITLRGPEGKEQVVLRADLEEFVSTSRSTMPEGIEKDLKPQDLADIIAHVRANVPLPKRKEFAGNEPKLVAPAADGTLLLSAAACEIYGST
ncbi:MAG: PVC-type heme-binding CxxCH protein, partial [Deltaproteobacteria bacterium]